MPELIKDKKDGLLFELGNPYDLYDKIKIFINQPDLIEALKMSINLPKNAGKNGREIETLYKDLLNGK